MEIELSPGAVEYDGGSVVGAGGVLGRDEGAEPAARSFTWLADLGDPLAPASLSYSSVAELIVVGTTFAFAFSGGGGGGAVAGGGGGRRGGMGVGVVVLVGATGVVLGRVMGWRCVWAGVVVHGLWKY